MNRQREVETQGRFPETHFQALEDARLSINHGGLSEFGGLWVDEHSKCRREHRSFVIDQLCADGLLDRIGRAPERKAMVEELFHWAFELAGAYNGLVMTELSEIEHCAYLLHQRVVDMFQYNLECEKDRGLSLHQEKFMSAVRSADDFPTESEEATKLLAQLTAGGFVYTEAKKAGDLVRQFLGRIIEAIGEHSIRYWASKEGESRFDLSKAGLILGSKAMIELESHISQAAEGVRACQPVFKSMRAKNPSM